MLTTFSETLKQLAFQTLYDTEVTLPSVHLREIKASPHKNLYTNAHSSIIRTIPKSKNNSYVHQLINKWTKYGLPVQ